MKLINRVFKNINIKRIAGFHSILGIDLNGAIVRIVELSSIGGVFNRFHSYYKVVNCFSIEFNPTDNFVTKAENLSKGLLANKVKSKLAVSSIQSLGMRSLITTLPSSVPNIDEWIRDHCERLLKVPISPRDLSFCYEVLSKDDSSISIEITFIRNFDLNECKLFFKNAGLELIALGAGVRDAQNVLMGTNYVPTSEKMSFVYCRKDKAFLTTFENGRILSRQTIVFEPGELSDVLLHEEISSIVGDGGVMLAGESSGGSKSSKDEMLRPFGLHSEYTLAAGLAMRGFLPELSPVNFLDKTEQAHTEEKIYASLFKRVVLACGTITIALLLTQSLVSAYLQSKIQNLEYEILAMGPSYTEVAALEQRVNGLRMETEDTRALSRRSNVARALHEIAAITPSGIWLGKVQLSKEENLKYKISITGYSKESTQIAEYLKLLERNHLCSNVILIRSGSPREGQAPVRKVSSPEVSFEIKAVVNE